MIIYNLILRKPRINHYNIRTESSGSSMFIKPSIKIGSMLIELVINIGSHVVIKIIKVYI